MATTFLEPGGDADFLVGTTNGFWKGSSSTGIISTDFVHGNHIKSIGHAINSVTALRTGDGVVSDAGARLSFYIYIVALPTAVTTFAGVQQAGGASNVIHLRLTSGGVLQLWNSAINQIGSNGATLSTGVWYRISLAYTIASTTVNRFELFKNGVSTISVTNATLSNITSSRVFIGPTADATFDYRNSDHYIDNSISLTDTGDIWVTAKRPVSNGTTNGFTTQIGSGGSGYGSGHSPQVNERPLSLTNGWSIQSASKITEEYTIEAKNVGDIDISASTIVDFMGWISAEVASASTGNIIVAGTATNKSITTTATLFTQIAGSNTYPAGNTDIGMDTNTVNQLFSLYECGVVVAVLYVIPPTVYTMVTAPASFTYTPQSSGDPVIRNLPTAPATFILTGMSSGIKLVIYKIKSLGVRIVNSFFSNRTDTTKINTRTQDL